MQTLLTIDQADYTADMPVSERFGVRAVIWREGLLATQQGTDGAYKLPGGGVERGETLLNALAREVREETGLLVLPHAVRELGEILEVRRDLFKPRLKYVAHSYYYTCGVADETVPLALTASEARAGYRLVWASPKRIVAENERILKEEWRRRDARFVHLLLSGAVR